MTDFAELEIALRRVSSDSYSVDFRTTLPGSDGDVRHSGEARFDLQQLSSLSLQTAAYGRLLTNSLLKDPNVRSAFDTTRYIAQAKELSLRVRLLIDPNAGELHNLYWETLQDPHGNNYLFNGGQTLFSRYLSSPDWQQITPRSAGHITALLVVASPSDLASYHLPPIDVSGEVVRATSSLIGISTTTLASGGTATLSNIADRLRHDRFDILYLVCHGSIVDGEPWLWLEQHDGRASRVQGTDFAASLASAQQRPRLVVLASCQSAGTGDQSDHAKSSALTAIGPQLAEAGVPAVVAMQGSVSTDTIARFMPTFFRELMRSGQIDRAVATARGEVWNRPDFWMPVLFMRLRSGRVWERGSVIEFRPDSETISVQAPSVGPSPEETPPVLQSTVASVVGSNSKPRIILLAGAAALAAVAIVGIHLLSRPTPVPDPLQIPSPAPVSGAGPNLTKPAADSSTASAPKPTKQSQSSGRPIVTSVSPNPVPWGELVTISGSGFQNAKQVIFSDPPAKDWPPIHVTPLSDTQITVRAPGNFRPGSTGYLTVCIPPCSLPSPRFTYVK